jgi:hypothetical protein
MGLEHGVKVIKTTGVIEQDSLADGADKNVSPVTDITVHRII